MKICKKSFVTVAGLCFVLCSSLAFANIRISAVRINMKGKSAVERITNTSSNKVLVLHTYVRKVLKTKALAETKDIVAFPRVLKLKPKQTKLVRIMLRRKATKSQMYRLFLYERPSNKAMHERDSNKMINAFVRFGLKISIPIYVTAK